VYQLLRTAPEHGSRVLQCALNPRCDRVRAAEHAPRGPFYFLERRHGLAEIVERGAIVLGPLRSIALDHDVPKISIQSSLGSTKHGRMLSRGPPDPRPIPE